MTPEKQTPAQRVAEPVEALVERVYQAKREPDHIFIAALTELAERVKAAEQHAADMQKAASGMSTDLTQMAQRAEAAEGDRQIQYDAAMAAIEGRAAAERERDELVEAMERVRQIGDETLGYSGREAGKVARAALAKVRGEAE